MAALSLILSCEYAGNQVPIRYRSLFPSDEILNSFEGWDPGALDITVALSEALDLPCFTHQTTRLLVDVNTSLGNPHLFSAFTINLGDEDKQMLLDKYYFPYRLRVEHALAILPKPVVHLSIRTLPTISQEKILLTDIGIAFNPQRVLEKHVASQLLTSLEQTQIDFRIDLNESADTSENGFTSYLRTRFSEEEYVGITLEINQKLITPETLEKVAGGLSLSLLPLRS